MIPEELVKRFIKWSVSDVYDEWQRFALDASSFAYELAIVRAREESDTRIALMKEYLEALVEVHELETKGEAKWEAKDLPVYEPIKDWR